MSSSPEVKYLSETGHVATDETASLYEIGSAVGTLAYLKEEGVTEFGVNVNLNDTPACVVIPRSEAALRVNEAGFFNVDTRIKEVSRRDFDQLLALMPFEETELREIGSAFRAKMCNEWGYSLHVAALVIRGYTRYFTQKRKPLPHSVVAFMADIDKAIHGE